MIDALRIKQIVQAALLAADTPLTVPQLVGLFRRDELTSEEGRTLVREALEALESDAAEQGFELKRVASGYRYQVRQELSQWVSRLWDEKPPRYSRALLETLALIAYKQPVTRGDIEQIRGVAVSQNIMRTLSERDWIRIVGQREVPGRPSLYGTTKAFLDYFNLRSLDQLPPISEIRELMEPMVQDDLPPPQASNLLVDPAQDEAETASPENAQDTTGADGDPETSVADGTPSDTDEMTDPQGHFDAAAGAEGASADPAHEGNPPLSSEDDAASDARQSGAEAAQQASEEAPDAIAVSVDVPPVPPADPDNTDVGGDNVVQLPTPHQN